MKREIEDLLYKLSQKEGCNLANIQIFGDGSGAVQTWLYDDEEFSNQEELFDVLEELINR